ncbi:MAG TPA: radical SAM protein, partial [Candidatus Nitrosocosmicus sp.]|nr:radical SAM protein [Candidatus Nitrosocosmicus sp.]
IIDLNIWRDSISEVEMCELLKSKVVEFQPDFIGISVMFNDGYSYLNVLTEAIHTVEDRAVVVVGGVTATDMYGTILKNIEGIDAVCYGEGEIPWLNLVGASNVYKVLSSDPSWITMESFLQGKKPRVSFVDNLDEIPPIEYDLVDIDLYDERLISKHLDNIKAKRKERELPIHSTRGCPFNCIFCCAATNHGKKVRAMSAERFLGDVGTMVEKYGLTKLSIDDDQFLMNGTRAKTILRGLSDIGIRVEVPSGVNVKFLDDEIALLMKKCGMDAVTLAIESGSEYMLKEVIDKPLKLEQIKPAVDILRGQGIGVRAGFVVGLPGEREEDRLDTMNLVENVGLDWSYFQVATPFIGSRLYDICMENGYIDSTRDISKMSISYGVIRTPDFTPEYITERAYLMNLEANFVKNYNMRQHNYETAAGYFLHVASRYPTQAFAHYYLAKAYEGMGESIQTIRKHISEFRKIVESSEQWRYYAEYFNLI